MIAYGPWTRFDAHPEALVAAGRQWSALRLRASPGRYSGRGRSTSWN